MEESDGERSENVLMTEWREKNLKIFWMTIYISSRCTLLLHLSSILPSRWASRAEEELESRETFSRYPFFYSLTLKFSPFCVLRPTTKFLWPTHKRRTHEEKWWRNVAFESLQQQPLKSSFRKSHTLDSYPSFLALIILLSLSSHHFYPFQPCPMYTVHPHHYNDNIAGHRSSKQTTGHCLLNDNFQTHSRCRSTITNCS